MVNSEMLVRERHLYRKLEKLISFKKIAYRLKKLTDEGYGKEIIFKMMKQSLNCCNNIQNDEIILNMVRTSSK